MIARVFLTHKKFTVQNFVQILRWVTFEFGAFFEKWVCFIDTFLQTLPSVGNGLTQGQIFVGRGRLCRNPGGPKSHKKAASSNVTPLFEKKPTKSPPITITKLFQALAF